MGQVLFWFSIFILYHVYSVYTIIVNIVAVRLLQGVDTWLQYEIQVTVHGSNDFLRYRERVVTLIPLWISFTNLQESGIYSGKYKIGWQQIYVY